MERSSPSRTAGVVMKEVTLGDKTYLLSQPDRVRKTADEESVIIARRLDMFPALARACAVIPEQERAAWRRDYIDAMICGIASVKEWNAYYGSLWRDAFRFWNALDPKEKGDKTLLDGVSWAYEILTDDRRTKDEMDALWLAVRVVSQEDLVGESSGSADLATPLTATQSTEAGQPCSTSSPNAAGA